MTAHNVTRTIFPSPFPTSPATAGQPVHLSTKGFGPPFLPLLMPATTLLSEMGHNDDGDPTTDTADRATLPGIGNDSVVVTTSTGASETVYSFGWYLRKMIVDARAKGATPVLSGMVPRNYWTGSTLQSVWPFAVYTQEVAVQTAAIPYLDHTKYSVNRWQALGPTTAKTYYPNDNTHTNAAGALINAQAFVTALKCANSPLAAYLNSAGAAVDYTCYR